MIKNMNKRVEKKINYLGLKMNYKVFIYMRLVSCFILFVMMLFLVDYGYIVSPLTTIAYYVFVEFIILDLGIKKRCAILEREAIDFFPIFLISLRSGRNVKQALKMTTDIIDSTLSREFRLVLSHMAIGKSVDESLELLEKRIPSPILNNIVFSIREEARRGTAITDSVMTQLGYIKDNIKKGILNDYKKVPFLLAIASIVFVFIEIVVLMVYKVLL